MCNCGKISGHCYCNGYNNGYNPYYNPLQPAPYMPTWPSIQQQGWVCQRCGRSYGPGYIQCFSCNNEIEEKEKYKKEEEKKKLPKQQLNG